MEELIKLLENGDIEQAYDGFKKEYELSNNIIALYYLSMIEFSYKKDIDQFVLMNQFIEIVKKAKKRYKKSAIGPLLSLCLEQEDYEKCYIYGKKALNYQEYNFVTHISYAKGLYYFKNNRSDKIEKHIFEALKDEKLSEDAKKDIYIFFNNFYLETNQTSKSEQLIDKTMLTMTDMDFLQFLQMQLDLHKQNESLQKTIEKTLNCNYKVLALVYLSNYYYKRELYQSAIIYLEKLKGLYPNPNEIIEQLATCYFYLNDFDQGIDLLKTLNLESNEIANYLIGRGYMDKDTKKGYQEAISYLNKALVISNQKPEYMGYLCECYLEVSELIKAKVIIRVISKFYPNSLYIHRLKIDYLLQTFQYDAAEKEVYNTKKLGMPINKFRHYLYCCAKKVKKCYAFYKEDSLSPYDLVKAYFYGDFGFIKNHELAKKYLKELQNNLKTSCDYSLVGAVIQKDNPEEAMKYFLSGYQFYQEEKSSCTCCIGFICDAKLKGLGTPKDIEGAYLLAKQTIDECYQDVSENLGNVYAECAIALHKDLNEVFEFLVQSRERRYAISRLFMIIKVGKLINKDIKRFEILYRESFQNISEAEKDFFRNNPTTYMMNNF